MQADEADSHGRVQARPRKQRSKSARVEAEAEVVFVVAEKGSVFGGEGNQP